GPNENANENAAAALARGGALANVKGQSLSEDCPAGGVDIELGVDKNGDGELSADEVKRVVTVCNGNGGAAALVDVKEEAAGAECSAGGLLIRSGLDADGDGALDDDEVLRTERLCNGAAGADGATTLVVLSEVAAGETCAAGGVKMVTGLDVNGDGTLSEGEVTQEAVVCHGLPGADGSDGYNSLTSIDTQVGAACDAYGRGGQRIRSGVDDGSGGGVARDGVLQDGEVDATMHVCNGSDGTSPTVTAFGPGEAGTNCELTGGIRVQVGSGTPSYVCNGATGATGADGDSAVVTPLAVGDENCAMGGVSVQVGTGPVSYVCNGATGATGADGDSAVVTPLAVGDENCAMGGVSVQVGDGTPS
ncbi:MAG: DUF7151 family protein, partial [Myxococcota bacterium]